jgi:hypothetical protein
VSAPPAVKLTVCFATASALLDSHFFCRAVEYASQSIRFPTRELRQTISLAAAPSNLIDPLGNFVGQNEINVFS